MKWGLPHLPISNQWKTEYIETKQEAVVSKTKVLVVEDESILRSLISSLLTSSGYEVQSASSAAEARKVAETYKPDVYFLDIELGKGATGIDLAHAIRATDASASIVFLTNIPEPRFIGADSRSIPRDSAYLYKQKMKDPSELTFAIESAKRKRIDSKLRDDKNPTHALKDVSKSQLDALHMVALGLSNAEIAERRGTTIRAVENLINRACEAANLGSEAGSNQRVKAARAFIKTAGFPQLK